MYSWSMSYPSDDILPKMGWWLQHNITQKQRQRLEELTRPDQFFNLFEPFPKLLQFWLIGALEVGMILSKKFQPANLSAAPLSSIRYFLPNISEHQSFPAKYFWTLDISCQTFPNSKVFLPYPEHCVKLVATLVPPGIFHKHPLHPNKLLIHELSIGLCISCRCDSK